MRKLGWVVCLTAWAMPGVLSAASVPFRRGDANQDAQVDISDFLKVLSVLFLGEQNPGCDAAMDANGDGVVDVSDGLYGLNFLFSGGAAPPEPFVGCGRDDSVGSIGCTSYAPCCLSSAVNVVSVVVKNTDGAAPRKGDGLNVTLTLTNASGHGGLVRVTPRLRSKRFLDFRDVPVGSVEAELGPGETKDVAVQGGPFLGDLVLKKEYAVGRGDYSISSVLLECSEGTTVTDTAFTGADFTVQASTAIFTAVVYDQQYLTRIHYSAGAEQYMIRSFTRVSEVFTPDTPGSSAGTYQRFPGGFDEMLGIHQIFRVFPGFPASSQAGGFCEQAGAYARRVLGLTRDWDIGTQATDPAHHGFDILVGLTPQFSGGATCGWLGVQVSGLFDFDLSLNRSQIIVVHEMGHIFGAPHCDPLQGYVMCAGEKHPHYTQSGVFVWHETSLDAMNNPYN
jgi:hypothetical protein